jgi:hypothetical protein
VDAALEAVVEQQVQVEAVEHVVQVGQICLDSFSLLLLPLSFQALFVQPLSSQPLSSQALYAPIPSLARLAFAPLLPFAVFPDAAFPAAPFPPFVSFLPQPVVLFLP